MQNESYDEDSDYSELYNLPVEELGLSEDTLQLVMSTGITSVAECLDYFLRYHDAMITAPFGYMKAMETEVKPRLKELGYLA